MVAVGVGDDNGADALGRPAERAQAADRVAIAQPDIDERACRAVLDQRGVAAAATPEDRQPNPDRMAP